VQKRAFFAFQRTVALLGDANMAAAENTLKGPCRGSNFGVEISRFVMKLILTCGLVWSVFGMHAWSHNQSDRAAGARDFDRKFDRAEVLYKGGNFSNALSMYLELYKLDTTNLNVCYKIGSCYLKTGANPGKAVYYLEKAVKGAASDFDEESSKERRAPITSYKLLGDAYHLNYKFDQAISAYQTYKQALAKSHIHDRNIQKDIAHRLEMCSNGKELMTHPAEVRIVNAGKTINSAYPDYAPRVSADGNTMIFTSRRPENTGGKTYDGGQYFEDIYIATRKDGKWQQVENIGWPVNTVGNEAAIGISADGQEILIYKDDLGDGNIYSSRLEGDKWTTPVKLNSYVNSPYWEPAAYLSADRLSLYFVSDRPGGFGGTDLYVSRRAPGGDWGRPVNLGPTVNTPYDEHSPYLHPDGQTLFFSSKGHETMGGYDVFFTHALLSDEKAWVKPTNVGYPINTPGDDAFYMVTADKQSAYYSTMMQDALGEKDIYMVSFPESSTAPLTLLTGTVFNNGTQAAKNVIITVTNNETNLVEGVYNANPVTGKYTFVLTSGVSHNISFESDGRMFYSENRFVPVTSKYTEITHHVNLGDVAAGSSIALNNIFFDFDDARVKPSSVTELKRIAAFMKKHPDVFVEVSGYADSKGTDDYNRKLSQQRAESVVKYLVQEGIDSSRLKASGQGISPQASNTKTRDVSGRESDRRVELRIIKAG
jgi:outer membrane protein OmpA-like peptidoglycan-associated protein/tetratricopeptide (TPR) repeat protein